ncbi:unnamed protein product [Nezara viridula]|uniref:Uncharacterized protein n=1 Tax=Nezara viridula TaxID=85310 RepID=A0A9P0MML4_NEZVI|nr:unnamed protein product [Nezara viridula]
MDYRTLCRAGESPGGGRRTRTSARKGRNHCLLDYPNRKNSFPEPAGVLHPDGRLIGMRDHSRLSRHYLSDLIISFIQSQMLFHFPIHLLTRHLLSTVPLPEGLPCLNESQIRW